MARTAKVFNKNGWTLFLFILLGIVLGSFLGYLVKGIDFLHWLNYGFHFSIGDTKGTSIVTLDILGVLVINFGLRVKVTVGSILGVAAAILIYRKI
ncbi:MAG TPA: DUF4321 domain-containing protein [Clostridiales bacterium]|nr:DUF4321 domain-containing protein [Clostridiales bacterium]